MEGPTLHISNQDKPFEVHFSRKNGRFRRK